MAIVPLERMFKQLESWGQDPEDRRFGEIRVTRDEQLLLNSISAATIDRMLAADRAAVAIKGRSTTKPGTLLRSRIPVRTFAEWDEDDPGFFELDLVCHCGGSGRGEFIYTLNMTDVFSGWTALGATKGRGERGTLLAIRSASEHIPFVVKGIDSDNDGAFINYHLNRYCRRRRSPSPAAGLTERTTSPASGGGRTGALSGSSSAIGGSRQTKEHLRQEYESTNPAQLLRQIRALLRRLEDTSKTQDV